MRSFSYKIVVFVNVAVLSAAVGSFFLVRAAIAQTATTTPEASVLAVDLGTGTSTIETGVDSTLPPLREVRIIGTKYTDYFSDGATLVAFPGDSDMHANIGKPNAATPSREGLTWDHSIGTWLYDTPSGDLEIGTFAEQSNGTYLAYLSTTTIENATSTPFLPSRIVVLQERPATVAAPEAIPTAQSAASDSNIASVRSANATTSATDSTENTDSGSPVENPITPNKTETQQEAGQVLGTSTEQVPALESQTSIGTSSAEEL